MFSHVQVDADDFIAEHYEARTAPGPALYKYRHLGQKCRGLACPILVLGRDVAEVARSLGKGSKGFQWRVDHAALCLSRIPKLQQSWGRIIADEHVPMTATMQRGQFLRMSMMR